MGAMGKPGGVLVTHSATAFPGLSGSYFVVEPEIAVLYLAANVHAGERTDARMRDVLALPIRWDRILELGHVHGVAGLVRHRLRVGGHWHGVPDSAGRALDTWHGAMRFKHLARARQLAHILSAASAAGIDPIVLKGAALAAMAYPHPAMRPMVDIDLLVKPDEVGAMAAILERVGYVPAEVHYSEAFNRARGYHLLFTDPAGHRLAVEVHWRVASLLEQRNALSASALRARTIRMRVVAIPGIEQQDALVLAPEAQIVYLATHAAKERHSLSELKLLADIAAIAGGARPPDWSAVSRFAVRVQARTATFAALALARNLLGAAVPPSVLADLRPPRPLLWALDRTLNPATILDPVSGDRRAIVKYLVVDSPATTARLLREHLIPPADAIQEYYPRVGTRSIAVAYVLHAAGIGFSALRKAGMWLCR